MERLASIEKGLSDIEARGVKGLAGGAGSSMFEPLTPPLRGDPLLLREGEKR